VKFENKFGLPPREVDFLTHGLDEHPLEVEGEEFGKVLVEAEF
jgi:hypothetical protein